MRPRNKDFVNCIESFVQRKRPHSYQTLIQSWSTIRISVIRKKVINRYEQRTWEPLEENGKVGEEGRSLNSIKQVQT